jgi:hypothetical protein
MAPLAPDIPTMNRMALPLPDDPGDPDTPRRL